MSPSPLTNEDILRTLRFSEEKHHRLCREYFFGLGLLTLSSTLPIPQVHLEHIQESCNKGTAIYFVTPHLEGHTQAYGRDSGLRDRIIFSIYEQWFRDHRVDIDFGSFVAKAIRIKIPSIEEKPTIRDIIKIHKAWCEHVEINLPLCSPKTDSTGAEIDDPSFEFHGGIGIIRKQNMYYELRPLFRALIMVVDDNTGPDTEKIVHLIRTNIPSKLSGPITFESISPKLNSDKSLGSQNNDVLTTTLPAAIDFVIALESREKEAFPESQRDPSIIDERGADPGYFTTRARSLGYTGPEIKRTSSTWVELAEGEDLLPPITPGVMKMRTRRGGENDPILARYRKSERRIKYRVGCMG